MSVAITPAELAAWLKAQGLPTHIAPAVLLQSPDSLRPHQRKYLAAYVAQAVSK